MIITCQNCGARFQIRDELVAGGPKRTKCKKCGEPLVIKPPVAAAASPAAQAAPLKESAKAAAESADLKSKEPGGNSPPGAVAEQKPVEAPKKPAAPAAAPQGAESPGSSPAAAAGTGPPAVAGGAEGDPAAGTAAEAADAEDIQAKLEKRRLQMEDEISGRLNKAALETLDFDVLGELADKLKSIEENTDFQAEPSTQLFACIQCRAIYSLFTEDPRQCANCVGDVALVRGDDILKQFGMFNR